METDKKYVVYKTDTDEIVRDCFVLCPDSDPAAAAAIQTYAEETDKEELSRSLLRWVCNYKNYPLSIEELNDIVNSDLESGRNRIWIWDMECKCAFPALLDLTREYGICAVYGVGEIEYVEKEYGKTWLAYSRKPYAGQQS